MSVALITEYRYITRIPGVCGGRPIIKGTRTPVKAIIGYYKLGLSVEEILEHITMGSNCFGLVFPKYFEGIVVSFTRANNSL